MTELRLFCLLPLLLAWSAPSSAGLSKTQREELCSKSRDECIWINAFFNRSHGFPIHNTVDYGHDFDIYCYEGAEPHSLHGLTSIWLGLHILVKCDTTEEMTMFFSNKSSDILESDNRLSSLDAFNNTFSHHGSPYNVFCIGVKYGGRDYVNYKLYAGLEFMWRFPILLVVGMALLFNARTLSRSISFHYGTGITLGIVASVLILLYVFSKIVPKKNILGLGILAGGFTLAGSFIYWLARHAFEVATSMWQYIIVYVLVAGIVSFAVIYRFGPVENPRTFNLIQWTIQLVALVLIALASQLPEAGFAFVIIALLFYFIPMRYNPVMILFSPVYWLLSCVLAPFCVCFSWFGSKYKYRFLTLEEYEKQGREETRKALDELRTYCKQSEMWDTIGRLKDANRFTQFLSGKDHVSPQEQVDHDWSFVMVSTDGDESDSDDDEYSSSPSHFPRHHLVP